MDAPEQKVWIIWVIAFSLAHLHLEQNTVLCHRKVFLKGWVCDLNTREFRKIKMLNTRENSMQEFILRIDELLCRSFSLIVTTRITVSCKFSSENQSISSRDLFLMKWVVIILILYRKPNPSHMLFYGYLPRCFGWLFFKTLMTF